MALIYKITNLINQKMYIGKTSISIQKRFKEHIFDSKKEKEKSRPLYRAFNKYGIDNFKIEIIENNLSDEEECLRERFWITYFQTYIGFDNCNGYNATFGGDSKHTYDYKQISDKYLDLKNQLKTAQYFYCDPETVRKACKEYNISIIQRINSQKIQCKETGEIFNSISEAGKKFNSKNPNAGRANISRALRKNGTAYKYHWIYI